MTKKHDIVLKSLKPQRDSNLHMTYIGKKTFINYTWFNCLLQQELRHNMGVSHTTLKAYDIAVGEYNRNLYCLSGRNRCFSTPLIGKTREIAVVGDYLLRANKTG